MKYIVFNYVLLIVSLSPVLHAQNTISTSDQIHHTLSSYHDKNEFNGVVLVSKKGRIIFHEGFGYASVEHNVLNDKQTKFLIGSATKSFTAIAVMQCVEKGWLELHTPISNYIPELTGDVGQLTLHVLMKNTSGLPVHLNRITNLEYRDISSPELIQLYKGIELSFHPGSKYEYSNLNYQLCALIVERVSGLDYHIYIKENILEAAGMLDSGVQNTHDFVSLRATGYNLENEEYVQSPRNYLAYAMGGGNMYATAYDLYNWDIELYGEALVSQESKERLFDGHPDIFDGYGYGFKIRNYQRNNLSTNTGKLVRHGGSMYGFICNIHRYLNDQVLIVVLGNMRPYPTMEITLEIENILRENSWFE